MRLFKFDYVLGVMVNGSQTKYGRKAWQTRLINPYLELSEDGTYFICIVMNGDRPWNLSTEDILANDWYIVS